MTSAKLGKEISFKTKNKVGMLAEISELISNTKVNIQAISAYAVDKDAFFRIVTTDNKKAIDVLKAKGFEVSEKEVVLLELENKPGAAYIMATALKNANIDLSYIYGTTCGSGTALIVFNSIDNTKAVKVLK